METPQCVNDSCQAATDWHPRRGIRASAGSGKTYALTGHYLRSFLLGAQPEQMLATTFTRKAAGEILGRVLKRLAEACETDEKCAQLAGDLSLANFDRDKANEHLLRLCRALHQVSISTIDSFFGQLLRGFRPELGLPPDFRILDEKSPEMERLRHEALRQMLASEERETLIERLDGLQKGDVKRSVVTSLSDWFESAHELFESAELEAWSTPALGAVLDAAHLERVIANLEALGAQEQDTRFVKAVASACAQARVGDWKKFLDGGLPSKILDGTNLYYGKEIRGELLAAYEPLIEHARAQQLAEHSKKTAALHEMLALYHDAYAAQCRREKALLLRDVPRLLALVLSKQSQGELHHRLGGEIAHLLLDEFQDTDPQQYAVLKPFADGIAARGDDLGLLFCVGDLKQSIYGWRGATPQIFEQFGQDFPSLAWQNNDESYRSAQIVLDAVNALFGKLHENNALTAKAPDAPLWWQQYFKPHTAQRDLGGYVEVIKSQAMDEGVEEEGEEASEDEAIVSSDPHYEFVAQRIKTLSEGAPCATIGVLVRSNEVLRRVIFALQRAGVAASAEGGSPISDDPAVGLILSALRLADHPSDSAARFHLRHSPLGAALKVTGPKALASPQAALEMRRALLHGFAATIAHWAAVLGPHCDARSAQRLAQLVELAEVFDQDESGHAATRPGEFVRYVNSQKVEEPVPTAVRVMTIHGAKGLEFDIVVLPELHKKLPAKTPKLIYTRDPQTLRINHICAYPDAALRNLSPHLKRLYEEYSASELREALCLLYVAMTRARHALHIVLPAPGVKKNGERTARPWSLAAIVEGGLCGESTPPADGSPLYAHGDADWYKKEDWDKKEDAGQEPAADTPLFPKLELGDWPGRVWKHVTPSALTVGEGKSAAALLDLGDRSARRKGNVLHFWLSRCEWPIENAPEESLLKGEVFGLSEAERAEYSTALRALLQQPQIAQALAQPKLEADESVEVWREKSFATMLDGVLVSGAFDRVVIVRDDNGAARRATLFDFKTGDHSDAITESYRPQLHCYREVLCQTLNLPPEKITTQLLFTSAGSCVTL
jgi:ATP-dependent exoDNAse (exonuclease V) beta subunit